MFSFEKSNQSVARSEGTMAIREQIKVMIEKLFFFRHLMEFKVHNSNIVIHLTFFSSFYQMIRICARISSNLHWIHTRFRFAQREKKEFTVKVKHIHAWVIFGNGSLFSIVLFVALAFSLDCSSFFVIELIYFFLCVIIR